MHLLVTRNNDCALQSCDIPALASSCYNDRNAFSILAECKNWSKWMVAIFKWSMNLIADDYYIVLDS